MQTKIILVAILAGLSVALAGVLGYQKLTQPETTPVVVSQPIINKPVINQPIATTSDETTGWQTYKNEQYGFEMKYPSDWGFTLVGPSSQKKILFAPKDVISKLESDAKVSDKEVGFTVSEYDNFLYENSILPYRKTNDFLIFSSSTKTIGKNQFVYYIIEHVVARFDYEKGEKTITADLPIVDNYLTFDLFNYKYLDIFNKALLTLVVSQPQVNQPVIKQPVTTTSDKTVASANVYAGEKCEYRKGKYEMRTYNESGQVTGMINGVVKEEIPNSVFDPESNSAIIFTPEGKYTYELYCLEEGNYQFEHSSVVNGEVTAFNATNIPFYPGQTHRYLLDWDKLAKGSNGATVLVDNDKDGIFEKTFSVGNTLTCQEYLEQTKK